MNWYAQWFSDALYLELYSHRDATEARDAVDLFGRTTQLCPGPSRILDLACGTGRHAFEFARLGYTVTAADLSMSLLSVARRKTQKFQDDIALVRGDMRHLPFRRTFHAVAQLFTAFGYFPTDEANEAVIAEVAGSLLPGGWYMLDFLNAEHVRSTLVRSSVDSIGGRDIYQERWIENDRVEKRIRLRTDDRDQVYSESVRLFSYGELQTMLGRHGFTVRAAYGAYDGTAFTSTSERCILFSERNG